MADTLLSTFLAFQSGYLSSGAAATQSVIADGSFWLLRMTQGASHWDIRDAGLSAGTTPPLIVNVWESLRGSYTGPQISLCRNAVLNSTQATNLQQSMSNVMTGLGNLAFRCSDYQTAQSFFTAINPGGVNVIGRTGVYYIATNVAKIYYSIAWAGGGSWPNVGGYTADLRGLMLGTSSQQLEVADYLAISNNWTRYGALIPDLGVTDDEVYQTSMSACCSARKQYGNYLVPGQLPLSWVQGPFGEWVYCPESRCVLYLANGQ